MACLREPCPSAWMLNRSAFVQGNIRSLSTCGWLQERRNYHIPSSRRSFQGIYAKLRPFYFTSSSPPPLCAIKETGIQSPRRWLFRDISLPSSWSAGFPNKVIFPASTPRLRFVVLSCGEQSKLGLDNRTPWTWPGDIRIRDSSIGISSLGLHDLSWHLGFSLFICFIFSTLLVMQQTRNCVLGHIFVWWA